MDGLKVGPSHTQLFRVHANTMEEAIQIAPQEEYSLRQARTPTSLRKDHDASTGAVQGGPATGASTGSVPMELSMPYRAPSVATDVGSSGACNVPAWLERPVAETTTEEPGELGSPVGAGRPTGEDLSPHGRSADAARHGGLAPESLGALEARKNSFRILIDSGASTNFARRQTVARNGDKYANALRESEGRGQVSVKVTDGTVINVSGVWMDLAVKFEDFDGTDSFLVLDMDKYDLILGMPWLEKHDPWIDWRGKAIGVSRPSVSDRALVNNVPTSVRDGGARDGRQGAYVPEEVLGVTDSNEDAVMSLATGRETNAHCQTCGIATTASPNAESRHAVWASTMVVLDGSDQAGNISLQVAEAAKESAKSISGVVIIVPRGV
ncbi:Hypothetical protein PHPALM_21237 [Phytophthora palmivora]|uniref:Gag protein n=1 Tax=Phytophthora palmivora TaxID=4796 RepID=A0A2P4XCT8_9STRA|nr:Hypothetical protein PHPALM_21237 [Phytophthora palmivora]